MRQLAYRAERAERSVTERGPRRGRRHDPPDPRARPADRRHGRARGARAGGRADGRRPDRVREAAGRGRESTPGASTPTPSGATRDEIARLEHQRDQVRSELTTLSSCSTPSASGWPTRCAPRCAMSRRRCRLGADLRAAARRRGCWRRARSTTRSRRRSTRTPRPLPGRSAPASPARRTPRGGHRVSAERPGADEAGRLAAVPPLEDAGPPTEAWQAEPMSILSQAPTRPPARQARPARCSGAARGSRLDRLSADRPGRLRPRRRSGSTTTALPSDSSSAAVNQPSVAAGASPPACRARTSSSSREHLGRDVPLPFLEARRHSPAASDGEHDPVGDLKPGVAPGALHEADDVAGDALGLELGRGLELERRRCPPRRAVTGSRPGRAAAGAASYSPGRSSTPPTCTAPSSRRDQSPLRAAAMTCWVRGAEPRAEGGGHDVEHGLGEVADRLEELDLLHVDLVGDQVRRRLEAAARPAPPRSGSESGSRAAAARRLADRVAGRAHLADEVHRRRRARGPPAARRRPARR